MASTGVVIAPSSSSRARPVESLLMSTESYSISRTARYDLTPMHELQPGFQNSVGRGAMLAHSQLWNVGFINDIILMFGRRRQPTTDLKDARRGASRRTWG